jgi:hypothetical protein
MAPPGRKRSECVRRATTRFTRCALAFVLLELAAAGCMSPGPESPIIRPSEEPAVAPEVLQQKWQGMWAEGAWPRPKNAAGVSP